MFLQVLNPELIINNNDDKQYANKQTNWEPGMILNMVNYHIIRDDFYNYVKFLKPNHGNHLTANQVVELLNTLDLDAKNPSDNNTEKINFIFPNCVINSWHDFYYGCHRLIIKKEFWDKIGPVNWLDARGVIFHDNRLKKELQMFMELMLAKCQNLIITLPPFMLITNFWEEILSKIEGKERVIFFTKKQSKSAKTTAATIIPDNIAKMQTEFYKSFKNEYRCIVDTNTGYLKMSGTNLNLSNFAVNKKPKSQEITPEQPLVIIELEKMKKQIEEYYATYPDAANLETGMLLEKINDIRESLGLPACL